MSRCLSIIITCVWSALTGAELNASILQTCAPTRTTALRKVYTCVHNTLDLIDRKEDSVTPPALAEWLEIYSYLRKQTPYFDENIALKSIQVKIQSKWDELMQKEASSFAPVEKAAGLPDLTMRRGSLGPLMQSEQVTYELQSGFVEARLEIEKKERDFVRELLKDVRLISILTRVAMHILYQAQLNPSAVEQLYAFPELFIDDEATQLHSPISFFEIYLHYLASDKEGLEKYFPDLAYLLEEKGKTVLHRKDWPTTNPRLQTILSEIIDDQDRPGGPVTWGLDLQQWQEADQRIFTTALSLIPHFALYLRMTNAERQFKTRTDYSTCMDLLNGQPTPVSFVQQPCQISAFVKDLKEYTTVLQEIEEIQRQEQSGSNESPFLNTKKDTIFFSDLEDRLKFSDKGSRFLNLSLGMRIESTWLENPEVLLGRYDADYDSCEASLENKNYFAIEQDPMNSQLPAQAYRVTEKDKDPLTSIAEYSAITAGDLVFPLLRLTELLKIRPNMAVLKEDTLPTELLEQVAEVSKVNLILKSKWEQSSQYFDDTFQRVQYLWAQNEAAKEIVVIQNKLTLSKAKLSSLLRKYPSAKLIFESVIRSMIEEKDLETAGLKLDLIDTLQMIPLSFAELRRAIDIAFVKLNHSPQSLYSEEHQRMYAAFYTELAEIYNDFYLNAHVFQTRRAALLTVFPLLETHFDIILKGKMTDEVLVNFQKEIQGDFIKLLQEVHPLYRGSFRATRDFLVFNQPLMDTVIARFPRQKANLCELQKLTYGRDWTDNRKRISTLQIASLALFSFTKRLPIVKNLLFFGIGITSAHRLYYLSRLREDIQTSNQSFFAKPQLVEKRHLDILQKEIRHDELKMAALISGFLIPSAKAFRLKNIKSRASQVRGALTPDSMKNSLKNLKTGSVERTKILKVGTVGRFQALRNMQESALFHYARQDVVSSVKVISRGILLGLSVFSLYPMYFHQDEVLLADLPEWIAGYFNQSKQSLEQELFQPATSLKLYPISDADELAFFGDEAYQLARQGEFPVPHRLLAWYQGIYKSRRGDNSDQTVDDAELQRSFFAFQKRLMIKIQKQSLQSKQSEDWEGFVEDILISQGLIAKGTHL